MGALYRRSSRSLTTAPIPALLFICATAGCGGSSTTSVVGPSPTKCAVSVTNNTAEVPADGGRGTLTVTAERECVWSARADAPWITLSGTSGQGAASLNYTAAANPDVAPRRGRVVVSEQSIDIVQQAAPCRYEVTPARVDVDAAGGEVMVTVRTATACAWRARSDVAWVTVANDAGGGSTTVRLTVAANTGALRSGTVTIADVTVQVHQAGPGAPPPSPPPNCTYALSPATRPVGRDPEAFTVTVTTEAACSWTAVSEVAWITPPSATGVGDGSFRVAVAANTGAARTGVVRVGDQTLTVQQSGSTCTYAIKPNDYHAGRGPDDVRVSVSAPSGCAWTATSPARWVTVAEGRSGSGDGTVRLLVEANNGPDRSADLAIAGETFRLRQNGCSTTIKPSYYHAGRGPDDITIAVTADSGCTWAVTSPVGWVTVAQGQTGTGSGTVRLLVEPNTGEERSVTLTIAGNSFTLRQDGSK